MALFGRHRDISIFRHVNRELMGNIITQQCAYYKINLKKTETNIYGEAAKSKFYNEPILLNALIKIGEQANPIKENIGPDLDWKITFSFLLDDIIQSKLLCETGDIIMYQDSYFEVDNTNITQFFIGKDPDYPYGVNPLNPQLEQFGYNVSVVCDTHFIPTDKVGIIRSRL